MRYPCSNCEYAATTAGSIKIHGGGLSGLLRGPLQITFLMRNTVYFFLKLDILLLYKVTHIETSETTVQNNTVRFLMFILSLTLYICNANLFVHAASQQSVFSSCQDFNKSEILNP